MAEKMDIPEADLVFKYSRSSGPGGQNINKVSTRVTLFFDLLHSRLFSDVQKSRISKTLANRVNKEGMVKITSQKYRTQIANRQAAVEKLKRLLTEALKEKPPRKKTAVPQWAKQKRLQSKRKQSAKKQLRTARDFEF